MYVYTVRRKYLGDTQQLLISVVIIEFMSVRFVLCSTENRRGLSTLATDTHTRTSLCTAEVTCVYIKHVMDTCRIFIHIYEHTVYTFCVYLQRKTRRRSDRRRAKEWESRERTGEKDRRPADSRCVQVYLRSRQLSITLRVYPRT